MKTAVRAMRCPDCDVELEPLGHDDEAVPATDDWTCPRCGARWHLDHSWLMVEVD